jgi:hypothetical protein
VFYRNTNTSEDQKSQALKKQEEHLMHATEERSHYNSACKLAKQLCSSLSINQLKQMPANSQNCTFHYSFDFAQQVHYPADPFQPGPIYFKVPRKCSIFGVNAEGLPAQVNYLIDECVDLGKGANVVISLLHHFFENYGIGENHVHLNCDNCAGQNKNNYMLWYLCWRVSNGLHSSVKLSFLIAGHTKFAPDWCFGLLKQKYRRTNVSCLQDLVDVVNQSTQKGINVAQLVGDEFGNLFVPIYDWSSYFLQFFKKIAGIKQYHHFEMHAGSPGKVKCKVFASSDTIEHIVSTNIPLGMPAQLIPGGLSASRKAYLYKEIREFCTPRTQDLVCPKPDDIEEEMQAEASGSTQNLPDMPTSTGAIQKTKGKGKAIGKKTSKK